MNRVIRVFVVDGNRAGVHRMTDRQFSEGEFIFKIGDPADGVFRVRSGEVHLVYPLGRSGAARVCRAGDVFGGEGFLTGDTRTCDAVADGPALVEFLRRNEFLAILTLQPDLLSPVLGPVFDLVANAAGTPAPSADVTPPLAAEPVEPVDLTADAPLTNGAAAPSDFGIRLIADGKRLRSVLGAEEIEIRELPFRIGRTAAGEGKDTYTDIDLAIADTRPFNLSRRHFAIEEEHGALIIRDFGSYHGTTINGLTLGGEGRPRTAPLMTGESELVAGKPDSPFRFKILVDQTARSVTG
jgi:hypothetical protein